MLLANAHRFAAIVQVAAELGVADRLAGGPLPVRELAAACGAHEQALGRILRSGALLGLFREVEPDCSELTPVSEGLRTDLPDGVRDAVLLDGTPMFWLPFGQLAHSARTGEPAFDAVFGRSFWSHVDSDARSGAVFDAAMTTMSRRPAARPGARSSRRPRAPARSRPRPAGRPSAPPGRPGPARSASSPRRRPSPPARRPGTWPAPASSPRTSCGRRRRSPGRRRRRW
ncbi:methyltransferase family protein [Kutzneria kofuensis]